MKTLYLSIGILLLTIVGSSTSAAQEQTRFKNQYTIGVAITPEWQLRQDIPDADIHNYKKFAPTFGIVAEGQFDRHNGMELGIFYRRQRYQITSPLIGGPLTWETSDYSADYLSLRLGYKFYSDVVNFSVGVNCDVRMAEKALEGNSADWTSKSRVGGYLSVSKDISLTEKLILEPEVHINPVWDNANSRPWSSASGTNSELAGIYVGGGLKLKYRF